MKKYVFEAGEKNKNRRNKEILEDSMLHDGFRRDSCIIAFGGGVTTDLAGFVAATYARGIPYINYSTTLLSAADAAVGGKTAVDTELATNLIGVFHQPVKVYIDICTWHTLDKRQISNGLAETIKHACISSSSFFSFLTTQMDKIMDLDLDVCMEIAIQNCKIKYEVVMQDEFEGGLRSVLNLGHTVGRAVETVSEYKLLHGEALSIGLVAEVMLSNYLGFLDNEKMNKVIALLEKAKLPIRIPSYIDVTELVEKLYTDKKVRNGKLHFVLQDDIGHLVRSSDKKYTVEVAEDDIKRIIENMMER